jgi:hypothetical protein
LLGIQYWFQYYYFIGRWLQHGEFHTTWLEKREQVMLFVFLVTISSLVGSRMSSPFYTHSVFWVWVKCPLPLKFLIPRHVAYASMLTDATLTDHICLEDTFQPCLIQFSGCIIEHLTIYSSNLVFCGHILVWPFIFSSNCGVNTVLGWNWESFHHEMTVQLNCMCYSWVNS